VKAERQRKQRRTQPEPSATPAPLHLCEKQNIFHAEEQRKQRNSSEKQE